jgi:uroporphyrinogen-III decarboxylase
MTEKHWENLLAVINGQKVNPIPVGFIIDSPWLPGWAGINTIDYFSSEQMWFDANLKAIRRFPEIMFLPGFWSEFGMCTEPSAFGAKCTWQVKELPYAEKIINDIKDVTLLKKPNPKTDGLLPFVLNRLKNHHEQIKQEGHDIKFAVSRGPLNIATFLAGSTEFLMAIITNPEETQKLLEIITDFIIDWFELQIETFPSIDGIFILDDIVGFLGEEDFKKTALPYLERIFKSFDVSVKFFHNDAAGLVCAPYLQQTGINLFNFSFQHSLATIKELTNNSITLLGDIPARDVLAAGTPQDVQKSVKSVLDSLDDTSRVILSCGGGMPPDVSSENIEAFMAAAHA